LLKAKSHIKIFGLCPIFARKKTIAKKLIMPKTSVKERLVSSIKASASPVFLRKEFDKFGDYR
jgi:hypothetical protein